MIEFLLEHSDSKLPLNAYKLRNPLCRVGFIKRACPCTSMVDHIPEVLIWHYGMVPEQHTVVPNMKFLVPGLTYNFYFSYSNLTKFSKSNTMSSSNLLQMHRRTAMHGRIYHKLMHGQIQINGQFKFIANAWASSNTWENLLQMHGKLMQIHGHPQMHGQPLRHAFMVKCFMNTWSESVPNVNALSNLEIQMHGQMRMHHQHY